VSGPAPAGRPLTGAARFADDTRRRFLATIVAHVPPERLVEVHLFPPIRQGGVETGVAVVVALPQVPAVPQVPNATELAAEHVVQEVGEACDPTDDAAAAPPADDEPPAPPTPHAPSRHTVFTARYRLTVKGPDRGKWDADVVEEADAPLVTVEAVVRGVQRRAGDTADPDRLGPDVVAHLVSHAPPLP